METVNPFNDDEFKKKILSQQQGSSNKKVDPSDYEIIEPEDTVADDMRSIISQAPKIPLSNNAKNIIVDASALAKNAKEQKAQDMQIALNQVFTKYNKEYGTNLQINFDSLSQSLVNVSDPKSRRVLELYLSEVFKSIRPILIVHMLSKLSLAIDYILDPKNLFDKSQMNIQDTFLAVREIMGFIEQIEAMKDDIMISGSDLELKKLSEESGSGLDEDDKDTKAVIDNFMDLFRKDNGIG
jgi:hypothetical protein